MEEIHHRMVHLEEILGVKLDWKTGYIPAEVTLSRRNLDIIINAIEKLNKGGK